MATLSKEVPQDQAEFESPAPKVNLNEPERYLSVALGTAFVVFGVAQRSPLRSLLMAGAGLAVAYRGITGHCHVYDAIGVDTTDSSFGEAEVDMEIADEPEAQFTGHAGNQIDKDRFEKLKNTQVDRGRDEPTAIEIAAEEVKELRRREGRAKEDFGTDLAQFDRT